MSNSTIIRIGDTDLDLGDNFSGIALTLQGPNIGDLTTRGLNVSQTIRVPDTPTNQTVYEHSNKVQSQTGVPYTRRTAKIIQNGIEIESTGIEKLQSAGNGFDIYIQSGAALFFDAVGDKMLSDLTGFVVTTGDAENTARRNGTSASGGILYPVADYGNGVNVGIPFVYDKTILDNIISDAGYIGEGSIFSNVKFLNTVTGAFASENGYVSSFVDQRRVSVTMITPQAMALASGVPQLVQFTGISEGGTNPYGYWDGTSKYLVNDPRIAVDKQLFNIMVRTNINITVPVGKTVDIYLYSNTPAGFITFPIATGVGSGTYSYENNTIFNAQIFNGGTNYFGIAIQHNSGVTTNNITVNFGTLQIEPDPNPLGYTFGSDPTTGNYFDDIASLLPDIKQKDFIKDIMINYGLIATEKNGVVTFTSYDEIIADRANALDWTSKRVPDEVRDKISYTPFSYGQLNTFKYTNVDPLVSSDYGMGSFEIDNDNIQEVKPIFKSIYSAARTSFGLIISAAVELFDGSTISFPSMFNKSSNRKLLVRERYSYEPSVTYMDGNSYSDYYVVYFEDPNQSRSMKFQQNLDDEYTLFIEALQKAKVCSFYYMLNETDIAGFDFTKLVFDTDTYYLVNKIFNFIPGKVTQVQEFKV